MFSAAKFAITVALYSILGRWKFSFVTLVQYDVIDVEMGHGGRCGGGGDARRCEARLNAYNTIYNNIYNNIINNTTT